MDGYWPAVRFNGDDGVIEVTVESWPRSSSRAVGWYSSALMKN